MGLHPLVESITKNPILLWDKKVLDTELERFKKAVENKYGKQFDSYWDLHQWSTENYADFWKEIWDFYEIQASVPYEKVLLKTGPGFLDNAWFSGAQLNYAQNILRVRDDRFALICVDELESEEKVTFAELYEAVRLYAAAFRKHGLRKGDRVSCFMSNRKEAVFAFLAVASIGAVWCGFSPFYGPRAAANMLGLIQPKILLVVDFLVDEGEHIYIVQYLAEVCEGISSLEKVVIVKVNDETTSDTIAPIKNSVLLEDFLGEPLGGELSFEQLPFSHPLCINFTSGTTGPPKGIVHSIGSFIGHLRDLSLQLNMKRGDVVCAFCSVGWSLWEGFIPTLALGATLLLFCGCPCRKEFNIWDVIHRHKVSLTYLIESKVNKLQKDSVLPAPGMNLESLRMITLVGNPANPQNIDFFRRIKSDVFIGSWYGATEVFGTFSGFDLNLPYFCGEIQVPALGVNILCFNDKGEPVIGERGELVIDTPSPSFPICLWKDKSNQQLKDIYLSKYEGVWAPNDECWINPKTRGIIVLGRSDDTLKQGGERFGSSDVYFAIAQLEELEDYVCVRQDALDGSSRAVLFVKTKNGHTFNKELKEKISNTIFFEICIEILPNVIFQVPDIPRNLNAKRMESVVRNIVACNEIPAVKNIRNPGCLKYFCNIPELMNYRKDLNVDV